MGKRISWAEPLITFEVPNSWPAIRQVPMPKDGLSYGKKSINDRFGLQEDENSLNTSLLYKNSKKIYQNKDISCCRYSFIIVVIAIIALIVYYKYYK